MPKVPEGYPPATVDGADLLHPEAEQQTYLKASDGEYSDGSGPEDHGYDASKP